MYGRLAFALCLMVVTPSFATEPGPAKGPLQKDAKQLCQEICAASFSENFDVARKKQLSDCFAQGLCPINMGPPTANMPWSKSKRFENAI
jgi:hypothetical protein